MKNNRKGFTLVELVIVIAVVAVLAAVMIPTFSDIIKKANISKDTQAVRNMNVILTSEVSASSAPLNSASVKEMLESNGISDFSPQTKLYTFYWIKNENIIILANESDIPVYPEEHRDQTYTPEWHDLSAFTSTDLPLRPEGEDVREPRTFTVTVTQTGSSVHIPFEIPYTEAQGYEEFRTPITLPESFKSDDFTLDRYRINKITVTMQNAAVEHKIVIRSQRAQESGVDYYFDKDEVAEIYIPYVTGNIEINIDVAEFCIAVIKVDQNMTVYARTLKNYPKLTFTMEFPTLPAREFASLISAETADGEPVVLTYNEENEMLEYKNPSLSAPDLNISVTTKERVYTVNMSMSLSNSTVIMEPTTVEVRYSPEHKDFVLILDLNSFDATRNVKKIINNFVTSKYKFDGPKYQPKFTYDAENNILTVSNIRCDFEWECLASFSK